MLVSIFNEAFTKNIDMLMKLGTDEAIRRSAFNKIYSVGDTTVMTEEFASTEGMALPTYLDEKEDLKMNDLCKGYRVSFPTKSFGHRICFSYETMLSAGDDKLIVDELVTEEVRKAVGMMQTFVEIEAHRAFNQAFTNAAITTQTGTAAFISPDGEAMISANHAYNSGQTFDNLLPAAPLTLGVFAEVEERAGCFVDPKGLQKPIFPTMIIVKAGGAAATAAKQILGVRENNAQYRVDQSGNINIYTGRYTIVESPWITSPTSYFFTSNYAMSGLDNPLFLNFRQRPQLQAELQQTRNLQKEYAWAGSFKFGLRSLPVGIRGSQGS